MSSLATRSREFVSQGIAEQLVPLIQLHDEIRSEASLAVDLERASGRIQCGVPAFDPVTVVRSSGDLTIPFSRAVKALERCGLTTTSAASELRRRETDVTETAVGWLLGERSSSDPVAMLAHRGSSLVANAVLRANAEAVARAIAFDEWERAICPCCGGLPDFALVHATGRTLVCARCDTTWERVTAGCLGCGATRAPTIARIRSPFIGYTLTICNACGRYLKERPGHEACQPLVERALTAELDAAAERRGLRT